MNDNHGPPRINPTNLFTGIALVMIGLFIWFWLIPNGVRIPSRVPNPALSPAFWPQIIALIIGLSGAWMALESVIPGKHTQGTPVADDDDALRWERAGALRLGVAIILLLPYYLAVREFGLLLPSIVAFIIYSLLAGERRLLTLLVLGIAVPTIITVFFIKAASILIPLGPLDAMF
ncbi:hypothetical protein J2T57_004434 [Natronocella acetinitrilica]|uniref:DUF1468 domain-containing protein n=1 Tax=Natronocella acetinitrilica TaxID=414046 RepID=A0AAE3KCQ9_9GAMM|nr:tripartite tricarboxylate transporter TctB family protein [Natronocella acetinitrilica]MCP1677255.1 hypothetical protein [Natronocella acetinitrilica]